MYWTWLHGAHIPAWEANSLSASQIPKFLWTLKFHYRVQKSPPLFFVQSQLNSVQTLSLCFFNIHFYIILPSTSIPSKFSFSLRFTNHNILCTSPLSLSHSSSHAYYMLRPSHPLWFDYPNCIWYKIQDCVLEGRS